jgi:uncharacterized protein YjbI with pentapeptide repeats
VSHADLSGLSLYGAQCDGINLFGARLYRTDFQRASLRGAELAFSYAAGASFRGSDMRGCSLYRAEIGLRRSRHASADLTDVNYDLGQEDIEDRCNIAGTDLTNVAEKELKDESQDGKPVPQFGTPQ